MRTGRFFAIMVVGWVVLSSISFGATYGGGAGTEADPYQIWTAPQMNTIGVNTGDWGKSFNLMADIDMATYTGTQYKIIGNSTAKFTGTFNGNGHIISNLTYITTAVINYVGLFGYTSNATIENLRVENINISINGSQAAGLAGRQDFGSITNCHCWGSITVSSPVDSSASAGGLVGILSQGTITSCCSMVSVASSSNSSYYSYAGGLAGYQDAGSIINCYNTGAVTSSASNSTSHSFAGGLAGLQNNGSITSCHNTGPVSSFATSSSPGSSAGGLVGSQVYGTITSCYSTSPVTCNAATASSASSNAGGLVGSQVYGTITSSYSMGCVTSSASLNSDAGGVVGSQVNSTLNSCYNLGSVNSSSSNSYYVYVSNAGGLAGYYRDSTIISCYSTGHIASFASSFTAGGLIGQRTGTSIFNNSFWDIQTSEQNNGVGFGSSDGAAGKTTIEMQTQTTFTSAGWNFGPWIIGRTENVLCLDGVDDYVEVPGYQGITGTASRTCCAWIKTTTAQQSNIISWGGGSNGQGWLFRVDANGALALGVRGGYVATAATVNDSQWHYVAAVLDSDGSPSVDEVQLYIDGILQSTTASSTQSIDTLASQNVMLGAFMNSSAATGFYVGLLDEVCIYGRALEPNELDPEASIPTEGLIAYWAMDENEGTVVHDSVSSYDGILQNATDSAVWAICEGTNYPRLVWQIPEGDWVCPDGVTTEDLDYFVEQWLLENCTSENNYCGGVDVDNSGIVDLGDYAVLAEHWLEGI